jgi:molecular chaperone GrpE
MADKDNQKQNTETTENEADTEIIEEFVPEEDEANPMGVIKKLRDRIKKLEAEKQEYLNGWQRSKADFVNFKKQTDGERVQMIKFASKSLLEEILPVLESFDMAMANKEAWEKVDKNWRAGVEYIAKQLHTVLTGNGITEINPLGEAFDLTKHEAVSFKPVDKKEDDHKVIAVLKKGYTLHGNVITPARVEIGEFK